VAARSVVIDAYCVISALLGGAARQFVFSNRLALFSPQVTLFEVAKHLPWMAKRIGVSEAALYRAYELLPIIACQPDVYESQRRRASELIEGRDPLDVPVTALALTTGYPIWSNDRDFEGLEDVVVLTTAALAAQLAAE
jgi:predicted nucleic acid-binding protein